MNQLVKKLQEQFDKMCATGKLFRSKVSGQELWDIYISSFKKEDNPVFRDPNSTLHNCNLCKNFIRRYGNIIAVNENYELMSIFDISSSGEYDNSMKKMSEKVLSSPIAEVFFETFDELNSLPYELCNKSNQRFKLGVDKNVKRYTKEEAEKYGVVKPNEIRTFHHFTLFLPKRFVNMTGDSVEKIRGDFRDAKNVFQRALIEISLDTLNLVRDLINQNSLLNGATHLWKVEQLIPLK